MISNCHTFHSFIFISEIEGLYDSAPREWTATSIAAVGVSGALVAGILAFTTSFVAPAFRRVCVPYVPATAEQIRNLMMALRGRSGTLLDIGSGDGRVVSDQSILPFVNKVTEIAAYRRSP